MEASSDVPPMPPPPEVESGIRGDRIGGTAEQGNWERFFKKYYREAINEAALGWPVRRSLEVDFFDIDKHDDKLAEKLLKHPHDTLKEMERALQSVDIPDTPGNERPELRIRIVRLPSTSTIDVRDLRSDHLGRLVAVKGLVKKVSEVRPRILEAVFQCNGCKNFIREPQDEHLLLKKPLECYEDQQGCGKEAGFKLITIETRGQMSRFVDTQKLEIQEAPENMKGGEQPQRLVFYAEDDLCGLVRPGERVTVNGVLRSAVKRDRGIESTLFEIFVDANSVEKHEQEFEEIVTTPEEEAEIRRFARDPEVYVKMRNSIAPTLFGLEIEKLTLLLQLFGGVEKQLPGKSRLRGDLHVLLVGDPGVAKSQLIRYMAGLAPRGIYTSGKSSSGAGLTAAAVKDDFGDGRWTLEAGAMVLADRGLLCVDEIDKMDKNDQSSMHEGMEQQSISVAKAGITATLQSRCSVLGAANPKQGRFDEFTPIAEQINFPPALLSRFDVIFVLLDKPDVARDAQLARFVLNVHRGGGMHEQIKHEDSAFTVEEADAVLRDVEQPVGKDFLRKYVAYAKRSCHPVLTEEARDRLASYYVDLRRQGQGEENKAIPLTARQLEALVRLAEASARVRLARDVSTEDTDRAIQIFENYMKRIGGSEGGIMDVDMVASGVSQSQRNAIRVVKDIIRAMGAGTDHGADYADVVAECERQGVPADKVRSTVDRLKQQGELYSPRDNHLKLT